MITSILDFIVTSLILITGIAVGRIQGKSQIDDNTDKLISMDSLIKSQHEQIYELKSIVRDVSQSAETWKRRYESLAPSDEKDHNVS